MSCSAPNATATAIRATTAHQGVAALPGLPPGAGPVAGPAAAFGSAAARRPGIQRRPPPASSPATGTATTSMSTGVNRPRSSSGSPASSQAATSSAGSTVSRRSSRPAVSAEPAGGPPPAAAAGGPAAAVPAPALIRWPPANVRCRRALARARENFARITPSLYLTYRRVSASTGIRPRVPDRSPHRGLTAASPSVQAEVSEVEARRHYAADQHVHRAGGRGALPDAAGDERLRLLPGVEVGSEQQHGGGGGLLAGAA